MSKFEEKNFHVLLVTENITLRNNLGGKLRFQGYNVEYATGGFHALHLIEKNRDFHLLLIHDNMHDMSGFEITSLARTHFSKEELPILFLSKEHKEEIVCDVLFAGANDFLIQTANYQSIMERARKIFLDLTKA